MAVDMFLKIAPIMGESKDKQGHEGEIDVLAWSWGASQSGTTHMGGGGGSGKASFQDLSLTKYVDAASADLLKYLSMGTHIASGLLTVRKAGTTPLEYIKLEMTDIIVTSISTGGSGGEDRLTENVTLNFAKYKYTYVPQNQDGSGGTEAPFGYDIAGNIEA
jgi:type VI secretion system secreted protein Hcp